MTQCLACGRGRAQAEEVGFGKPNLNQSGTKASAGRLPGAGGQRARREGESPGIVRQLCPGPRCEGNSAALSGSGHTAHYHTAGLVNWAGLGTRSGGQGCGHSPAVPQAGPSGQGPSHRWPCGQPAKPVAFPEPKQPPGFSGDTDKSAGLGRETTRAPHRDQRSLRPRGPAPPAMASAHRWALPEAASKLWLCQPGSSTPARITLRKKGGPDGEGPGAAGARLGPSAHGEECSFLCRPPSACRPAHPGVPSAEPSLAEGAVSPGSRRQPLHLRGHQALVSSWVQMSTREGPECAGLMRCVLRGWGSHLGCPPSLSSPGSGSSLSLNPGHRLR